MLLVSQNMIGQLSYGLYETIAYLLSKQGPQFHMICLDTYKTHCLQLIPTNFRTIVIQFFQLNLEKPMLYSLCVQAASVKTIEYSKLFNIFQNLNQKILNSKKDLVKNHNLKVKLKSLTTAVRVIHCFFDFLRPPQDIIVRAFRFARVYKKLISVYAKSFQSKGEVELPPSPDKRFSC